MTALPPYSELLRRVGKGEAREPRPRRTLGRSEWVAEDVEWLLSQGESPAQILKRLDRKASSVTKALVRVDRLDLAGHFWAEENRERKEKALGNAA